MRPLLLCCLLATIAWRSAAVNVPARRNAPVSNPPQFILVSHDDAVNGEARRLVLDVTDSVRNPDGCKAVATWFACTKGCDFSCDTARSLYNYGHEIATHTVNHLDMRRFKYNKAQSEIVGARTRIVGCGIPRGKVTGFRTPFLSDSPTIRRVLAKNGFRYDSSIGARGGANKLWPATMDGGVPYDCSVGGNLCAGNERYPGLWQIPLYETGSRRNLMDYCTNESNGNPIRGCSAYDGLKQQFDQAYGSNRAPVTVGVHSVTTGYLQRENFRSQIKQFLSYARKQGSDVWIVTHAQFLDWMESPVPASKMTNFMKKYRTAPRC